MRLEAIRADTAARRHGESRSPAFCDDDCCLICIVLCGFAPRCAAAAYTSTPTSAAPRSQKSVLHVVSYASVAATCVMHGPQVDLL